MAFGHLEILCSDAEFEAVRSAEHDAGLANQLRPEGFFLCFFSITVLHVTYASHATLLDYLPKSSTRWDTEKPFSRHEFGNPLNPIENTRQPFFMARNHA